MYKRQDLDATIGPLLLEQQYELALGHLAQLRAPVDDFFESVMVNSDDPAIRLNRLRLLSTLRRLFTRVADLALLNPAME